MVHDSIAFEFKYFVESSIHLFDSRSWGRRPSGLSQAAGRGNRPVVSGASENWRNLRMELYLKPHQ